MHNDITISIVIPTCNRKVSLLRLLASLMASTYPFLEVIIVDSGKEPLSEKDLLPFKNLKILCIYSEQSVCIQRNIGIKKASGQWIFLCDDDLEVPPEYLSLLVNHIKTNEKAGAVSGLVLQMDDKKWGEQYPITSSAHLIWNFIFQLSLWGEINCGGNNIVVKKIEQYYKSKGNHISKAGWPVLTDFSGDFFTTPVYGLGASLVRKEWLIRSPYDEVLDANGIGDNYGVAVGFPQEGIHVLKRAFVYHHRELINRPLNSARYLKRILALHYFVKSRPQLKYVSSGWFLWSLFGTLMASIFSGQKGVSRAAFKATMAVLLRKNPYLLGARIKRKVVEPTLYF